MASSETQNSQLRVRYFRPAETLQPYFLGFFLLETFVPEGMMISDLIMPTWGLVSWRDRKHVEMRLRDGTLYNAGMTGAVGPFDHAVPLDIGKIRQWTAILLPAGWARFVAAPARDYANRAVEIRDDEAFRAFAPITDRLFAENADCEAEIATIQACLQNHLDNSSDAGESRIRAITGALLDANVAKVSDLAMRARVSRRTLGRVCDEAFGLPPKMLLRRQRFIRSIAKHTLQDSKVWTDAIDDIYHDQPQFVREFRDFTGMSPSQFAKINRPMVNAVLLEGFRIWQEHGEPSQQH